MMVELHFIPGARECAEALDDEQSRSEWNRLAGLGVVEVWYWYESYGYDASGAALLRFSDGRWDAMILGHCSCYGPLDWIEEGYTGSGASASLEELRSRVTKDYYSEDLEPLFLAAKGEVAE